MTSNAQVYISCTFACWCIAPTPKGAVGKKMANDNHLFPITCYNVIMLKQDYYNEFFELGQQKITFQNIGSIFCKIVIEKNIPVIAIHIHIFIDCTYFFTDGEWLVILVIKPYIASVITLVDFS